MHLKRRDLYKLTAIGAVPIALAACGRNLEPRDGRRRRW